MKTNWILHPVTLLFISVMHVFAFIIEVDIHSHSSCEAILYYKYMAFWDFFANLGEMLWWTFAMLLILGAGIALFFIVKRWIPKSKLLLIRTLWFVALPVVVFFKPLLNATEQENQSDVEQSLCAKTQSNGMITTSAGLTLAEYMIVYDQLPVLPDLPPSSRQIDMYYYSDGFLPDYRLRLHFFCARSDSAYVPKQYFNIIIADTLIDEMYISYHQGRS